MGNEDEENDYDTDATYKPPNQQQKIEIIKSQRVFEPPPIKPITVHQIIAKRLPELNLPELVRCSTPFEGQDQIVGTTVGTFGRGSRISAYDNVEKGGSSGGGYASTLINFHDSAQSDDGTVFSEPWDSSQWDSFMPVDGEFFFSSVLNKVNLV